MEQIQPSRDGEKSSQPRPKSGSILKSIQSNPALQTFPGSKNNNNPVISPLINSKTSLKPYALPKSALDISCHTSSPSIYTQHNNIRLSSTNHSSILPNKHKSGLQRLLGYRHSYFPKLKKKSENIALSDNDILHLRAPHISNDIDSDYFSLIDSTFTFGNFINYFSTTTSEIRRSTDSFTLSEKNSMSSEHNANLSLEEIKHIDLTNSNSLLPEKPTMPSANDSGNYLAVHSGPLITIPKSHLPATGPPSIQPIPPKKEQDPKSYLRYLEETFSRTEIGSLISKRDEFHTQVLEVFMDSLSFENVSIDMALRNLVSILYLPKEGQQIDRIISVFSKRYYEANRKLFTSEDVVYSLSFSILLLHTDAHNKLVKRKMTKKEYVKQAQQLDTASIPEEILEILYDNITIQEFFRNEDLFDSSLQQKVDSSKQSWFQKWYDPNRGIATKHSQIQTNHANTAVKVSALFGSFRPDKLPFSFCSPLHMHNKNSHAPFNLQVKGLLNNFHQNFKEGPTSGFSYSSIDDVSDITELKCHSEGFVLRKSDINDSGRKTHLRTWREFWAVLSGSQLLLFKEVSFMRLRQHVQDQPFIAPKPYSVTSISNGISLIDHEYTKHDNVFRFITSDERQYLFRVESQEAKLEWMSKINFMASFSSISICPRKSFCSIYGTESPLNIGSDTGNNEVSNTQKLNNAISLLNAPIQKLQNKIDDDLKLLYQIGIMVVFTKHTRDRVLYNISRIKFRLRQNHLELQRLLCYQENLLTYLNFSSTSNSPKLSQLSSEHLSLKI